MSRGYACLSMRPLYGSLAVAAGLSQYDVQGCSPAARLVSQSSLAESLTVFQCSAKRSRTVTCLSSDLPNACARPPAHHTLPAACLHRRQSGGPCWPSGLLPLHGPVASRPPQPAHARLPLDCTTPTSGHPGVYGSGSERTQPSSERRRAHLPEAALQTASSATDAKTTSGAVQRSFSQPRSRTVLAIYTSAARPGSANRAGHPGRRHSKGIFHWQRGIATEGGVAPSAHPERRAAWRAA